MRQCVKLWISKPEEEISHENADNLHVEEFYEENLHVVDFPNPMGWFPRVYSDEQGGEVEAASQGFTI